MMDPLAIPCPVCGMPAGEACRIPFVDRPRRPHSQRTEYAASNVVPCTHCRGSGWRPARYETKGPSRPGGES